MSKPLKLPAYRRHANGQGYSSFRGERFYFGKHDLPDSRQRYEQFIRRIISDSPLPPSSDSQSQIIELVADYLDWSQSYYVKNGQPSAEHREMKRSLQSLVDLYGTECGADAGPRWIMALQNHFVAKKHCRNYVNKQVNRIRRFFRWCCSRELLPAELYHKLVCVESLKIGRTAARETAEIQPVARKHIETVLPFLPPTIRAMVQLQYLCGMRPQDVCHLRPCDIDRTSDVWLFSPIDHKNAHRGQSLVKAIPLVAQAILSPYLSRDDAAFCFDPRESEANRLAELRKQRKSPVQPSQQHRNRDRRSKMLRERYDSVTYRRAVVRGIENANRAAIQRGEKPMPPWSVNHLRHAIATDVAAIAGQHAAQLWLGHSDQAATRIYTAREVIELAAVSRKLDLAWAACSPLSSGLSHGDRVGGKPASDQSPSGSRSEIPAQASSSPLASAPEDC